MNPVAPQIRLPFVMPIRTAWWRPTRYWLMCPYVDNPGVSFQVGDFATEAWANLACRRLCRELQLLRPDVVWFTVDQRYRTHILSS